MNGNMQKRALLLIDVQNQYVSGSFPIKYPSLDVSLPNISRAISIAKDHGIPIVVVKQVAPESSPIFAEGYDR
jgi:nicotinamidase-related amidase